MNSVILGPRPLVMENWRGVQGMCPLMILFYDNWIDPLLKKFLYWCMKWSKWTLSLSLHPICNHTTIVVGYQRDPKGLRFYYSKEPKTTIFRFSIEEFSRQKEYVFLPNFVNASSLSSNGNFSRAHSTISAEILLCYGCWAKMTTCWDLSLMLY